MTAPDQEFTHLDTEGNPTMVDVGDKAITTRTAWAQSIIHLPPEVAHQFTGAELHTKKGPVFQTAIIAGTMAAKKTHELIPLCHPLFLEKCTVQIHLNDQYEAVIDCKVKVTGKTGVEMEALTGASVAALTIYDMCKAFTHDMVIRETRLMGKAGGKRNFSRESF
ncbi:MAG: cyclic pyranopterin monophosphate synthase MoaC [Bacteroidota bacterium]